MATVLISCVENKTYRGWGPFNGGIKLYSLWAKLLNDMGHYAAVVTYDGTYQEWLIEHPPIISMDAARAFQAEGRDIRYLTGWIVSDDFIALAGDRGFYFFDAEMSFTAENERHNRRLREHMAAGRIKALGTHSRTIQAWYMATFGATPHFIREWSDPDYWQPDDARRAPNRIGYMDEGSHTDATVAQLQVLLGEHGVVADFLLVQGDERQVRDQMQTCDLFLGLNVGKSALWGEGCPRSPQEAQHVGAVPVAFDVFGNHEYIIDGVTGYLVPRGDVPYMARVVAYLLTHRDALEQVRISGLNYAHAVMSPQAAAHKVKGFLNL